VNDDPLTKTTPLTGASRSLTPETIAEYRSKLAAEWRVVGNRSLEREFTVDDYAAAHALATRLGELALKLEHYPVLTVAFGRVAVSITTPRVSRLTELDFLFAFRADKIYENR
jgi:pterin-4a-carbinolamine dehydratase